jgi:hypothetical protein
MSILYSKSYQSLGKLKFAYFHIPILIDIGTHVIFDRNEFIHIAQWYAPSGVIEI